MPDLRAARIHRHELRRAAKRKRLHAAGVFKPKDTAASRNPALLFPWLSGLKRWLFRPASQEVR